MTRAASGRLYEWYLLPFLLILLMGLGRAVWDACHGNFSGLTALAGGAAVVIVAGTVILWVARHESLKKIFSFLLAFAFLFLALALATMLAVSSARAAYGALAAEALVSAGAAGAFVRWYFKPVPPGLE